MTIHVTGTIFTSEGLKLINGVVRREDKVFPLGPESGIEVGDDYWGMWWNKYGEGVLVTLDGHNVSEMRSNAVERHTMKANVEGGGSIEARWMVT